MATCTSPPSRRGEGRVPRSALSIINLSLPSQLPPELQNVQSVLQRSEQFLRSEQYLKRNSRASDTSSAYSGSDMMQSSIDDQDIDLSGLVESIVDSDDEEGYAESTEVSYTPVSLPCRRRTLLLLILLLLLLTSCLPTYLPGCSGYLPPQLLRAQH